ncbi:hypothetical protein DL766_003398 [Monosporascus sp. MC13-8B]|uniref:Major facilitator superfamily (MFS) profile domain-containing protein n=1 Tax=Monosporascus cannonballus TaxID=155416 RepID=A0ABY0GTM0_9PEZI|nr:hypothetical protein DL762_009349 [Monosporascus cannonballus]RYO89075.1 hypothetical protein DL763_005785 [Monosporascus cannonballus]RYP33562.1 hypothetical protein DL766_003398 [Monosporascus sp. MC13-8B]
MSGTLSVLVGRRVLASLRVPEDDYVTTLDAYSSATATPLLPRTDPRAAALLSLSMALFGTGTVLFTSVPPPSSGVWSLVDYGRSNPHSGALILTLLD